MITSETWDFVNIYLKYQQSSLKSCHSRGNLVKQFVMFDSVSLLFCSSINEVLRRFKNIEIYVVYRACEWTHTHALSHTLTHTHTHTHTHTQQPGEMCVCDGAPQQLSVLLQQSTFIKPNKQKHLVCDVTLQCTNQTTQRKTDRQREREAVLLQVCVPLCVGTSGKSLFFST